jgi:putative hydrolase of the HAD superfamily
MSLILAFDLDDTLYPEQEYVQSGMQAVSKMLSENFSIESGKIESRLLEILEKNGRGSVFNLFLIENNLFSKKTLRICIDTYRHHSPNISLYPEAIDSIKNFNGSKYLVTDGHKIVQQLKIDALNISNYFKKIYLTNRYGKANAKPSLYCFERILERENSNWDNLIYVGDNPAKDFINLNSMGSKTIRIMTGRHKNDNYPSRYDAQLKINSLSELKVIFKENYE